MPAVTFEYPNYAFSHQIHPTTPCGWLLLLFGVTVAPLLLPRLVDSSIHCIKKFEIEAWGQPNLLISTNRPRVGKLFCCIFVALKKDGTNATTVIGLSIGILVLELLISIETDANFNRLAV